VTTKGGLCSNPRYWHWFLRHIRPPSRNIIKGAVCLTRFRVDGVSGAIAMVDDGQKQFLDLYTANQRRLYGYIVTLVPNRNDAEEIFSQTTLVLWEKWAQFDPTRSFISWACGVARNKVLQHQAKPERHWEGLSEDVVATVSEERDRLQHVLDQRSEGLMRCMDDLKAWQRHLVETCYSGAVSIAAVAHQMGITPNAVSSRLRRIRRILHECVDRTVQSEGQRQ
jgi:RNA polymerase sigma-70 factor, ECF subfamily